MARYVHMLQTQGGKRWGTSWSLVSFTVHSCLWCRM